jgi:hypothetical protein
LLLTFACDTKTQGIPAPALPLSSVYNVDYATL